VEDELELRTRRRLIKTIKIQLAVLIVLLFLLGLLYWYQGSGGWRTFWPHALDAKSRS